MAKGDGDAEGIYEEGDGLEEVTNSHRPLTLLRLIRGIVCLFTLCSTAFVTLVILGPFLFLIVRLYNIHTSRAWISFFFGHWLSMWPYLFEKINNTKVIFSGDQVPNRERVMVLCNHRTEVDWMYIWNLALRKDSIGATKYALKSSVRNLPVFGSAFHILEFLLLDRKWEVDKPVMDAYLSSFKDRSDAFWFVLFPEGTDFTKQKMLQGNKYAKEHGLQELKHVLMPRTKGFVACLEQLGSSMDAVYDLTIGYKFRCPLFVDNLFGIDPAEVHIHVCRIPMEDIPKPEKNTSAWLHDAFYRKDELLSKFYCEGSFPDVYEEKELDTRTFLLRVAIFMISTVFTLRYAIFWYSWVRNVVAVSFVLLSAVTYLKYKPKPL